MPSTAARLLRFKAQHFANIMLFLLASMQLKQRNAFISVFVTGNLKEAFQQENMGVIFKMELHFLSYVMVVACCIVNHFSD